MSTLQPPGSRPMSGYQGRLEEVLTWLLEAEDRLAHCDPLHDDLEVVKRQFREHETFLLELAGHLGGVGVVLEEGARMFQEGGLNREEEEELRLHLLLLNLRWEDLRVKSMTRQAAIHDALMTLHQECPDDLRAWLTAAMDRVSGVADVHEHGDQVGDLQRQQLAVDQLSSPVVVVDETIPEQTYSQIEDQLDALGERWADILQRTEERRAKLQGDIADTVGQLVVECQRIEGWLDNMDTSKQIEKTPASTMAKVFDSMKQLQVMRHDMDLQQLRIMSLQRMASKLSPNVSQRMRLLERIAVLHDRWDALKVRGQTQKYSLIFSLLRLFKMTHKYMNEIGQESILHDSEEYKRRLMNQLQESNISWSDIPKFLDDQQESLAKHIEMLCQQSRAKMSGLYSWFSEVETFLRDNYNVPVGHVETLEARRKQSNVSQNDMKTFKPNNQMMKKSAQLLFENTQDVFEESLRTKLDDLLEKWNYTTSDSIEQNKKLQDALVESTRDNDSIDEFADWLTNLDASVLSNGAVNSSGDLFQLCRVLVCQSDGQILINQLKKECLEQLVAYSNAARKELVFLEAFVAFLCTFKNSQSIITRLQFHTFCRDDLSFLNNIMKLEVGRPTHCENLTVLQDVTKYLQKEACLFFIGKFKEAVTAHIEPAKIKKREMDGRLVIEVTGKSIVVSEILQHLEKKLVENSAIEEVRFVGADIVHIDADLENKVWHGKNIVIFTKKITVHDKVTWNVSGKPNDHIFHQRAEDGDEEGERGVSGADGYAGESGGNVSVQAEDIQYPENFTIISHGGYGSGGQDGGNGEDGEDGIGLTQTEFNERFPSVVSFIGGAFVNNLLKTLENIKKDLVEVTCEEHCKNPTAIFYRTTYNNRVIEHILEKGVESAIRGDIFIEGKTGQGNEFTLSRQGEGKFRHAQAFLLYKGSLGHPGGHGGEYGLGGQGGYAGEMMIRNSENSNQTFNIRQENTQGNEGEKGKGGVNGKHGINGQDIGYTDYQFWSTSVQHRGKLILKYYNDSESSRIWCPFKQKYAEISTTRIDHTTKRSYEERNNTRINNERQRQSHSKRKKSISQSKVVSEYSYAIEERDMLQGLKSSLDRFNQHAKVMIENTEQGEKQTIGLGTECRISSNSQNRNASRNNTTTKSTVTTDASYRETAEQNLKSVISKVKGYLQSFTEQHEKQADELGIRCHIGSTYQTLSKDVGKSTTATTDTISKESNEQNVKNLIDELKNDQLPLDNWFKLKDVELEHAQLDQLFSIFETKKNTSLEKESSQSDTENKKVQVLEQILIEKYRFATLQEIAKSLPAHQDLTVNLDLTAESAARYLVVDEENHNKISHSILGALNQYIFENGKEQHEKISKFCKQSIQNTDDEAIKHLFGLFVLEAGKLEKIHPDIRKLHDEYQWFLEKQARGLITFPETFKKLDNDCHENKYVFEGYTRYIVEKGPLSESYRKLLAHVFDVNIRIYIEDPKCNQLTLLDHHNPSSKQVIHILSRDNKFIQLSINVDYLRLDEERERNGNLYTQIIVEIESFRRKPEFDDYLGKQTFSSDGKIPEEKIVKKIVNQSSTDEYRLNDKQDVIGITEYFSSERERQQLKERLEKISDEYIGRQDILRTILRHFSSEGKHVTSQELFCLMNSILTSVIEDSGELNVYCWIVSAYPQKRWINELIVLQLENHFKESLEEKNQWRKYLSKIENMDIKQLLMIELDQHKSSSFISTQCIGYILYLLSNIPNEEVSLEGLELSEWSYALKEKYWECKSLQLTDWQDSEKLQTASYYLLSLENTAGTSLVEEFTTILGRKKQELSPDKLIDILSEFYIQKWNLGREEMETLSEKSIDEWMNEMQKKFTANGKERNMTQLVELIEGNANTSKGISDKLSTIKDSISNMCTIKYAGKFARDFTDSDISNWTKVLKEREKSHDEMLAIIDRAIQLRRGYRLRDTQKLSVLALFNNERNTLAQVSTGEGKSLIVMAAAIMKALCGETVDIITSSSVLAKRDAEVNRDIYELFGINVAHNCSEDIEKRKEAYSGNQIVYGDLSRFQRDYLLDTFYEKNISRDRAYNNVIIDEVDSMLLDKGNNMLYLSHDLAGLDKLESVYVFIWQCINRPAGSYEELSSTFDSEAIKEAVLNDLFGLIKREDIKKLDDQLNEHQINDIWRCLIEHNILDNQGRLKEKSIVVELEKVLPTEFSVYKDCLGYLLKECHEREKNTHVPNYLKSFIEEHLEAWINNAIVAFLMDKDQDYVVDVDRTGASPDCNPNIRILDRDTGTDQSNSQWGEALHQFLQLKHGCKLSLQNLKAVFISNVSFLKLYRRLYGLTGTLGSQRERDLLKAMYEVDFVTIPTSKSKQFHEEKPFLCNDKEEWIKGVRNEVMKIVEQKKRSVLIICKTIDDVETLHHKAFGGKDADNIHTYTRDYEKFDIAQGNKELDQGQIIIATNLAGRGTDIRITEELKKMGGLHVCLTYLPDNSRIEQQAFGRAARSGAKGSGQLIIMDSIGQKYSNAKILDLKRGRDAEELRRISDIKTYYETQISTEENCFKRFKEQYEQLTRMLNKDLEDESWNAKCVTYVAQHFRGEIELKKILSSKDKIELRKILLQCCLDKWALWLDRNSERIHEVINKESKIHFDDSLDKFISQLKNLKSKTIEDLSAWVEEYPIQMIKLGKYFSQIDKHDDAIKLFDEVIKQEPCFSEAAHYYKAYSLSKKIDWEQKPSKEEDKEASGNFKKELREAARIFDERYTFSMNAAGIIGKIKQQNNNQSIIQIDAYEKQQKSLGNIYYLLSQSIDDILSHPVTPQSFINHDIDEELAVVLYEDLLRKSILNKPRVGKKISEEELRIISSDYGVSLKALKNFLSNYKGAEIDEHKLKKAVKKEIHLPSRETFWKLCIDEEVFCDEVQYVIVDNEKLRKVDPSLSSFLIEKASKKELEKQILRSKSYHVTLAQLNVGETKNDDIFKKVDFMKFVGDEKYRILKKNGILSCNKIACIDTKKIGDATFPCYDSITSEDFTNVSIAEQEAEKILAELVLKKIIEKDDSKDRAYRIIIHFEEIEHIQLLPFPVYENAVKALLSVCFTYKICLQKIEKQLEENNVPINLQLMTKPHQSLVLELFEKKVIKPVTVRTGIEDFEEKLKSIYTLPMTNVDFKCMLSQNMLIAEECREKLFDHLVEKRWITKSPVRDIFSDIGTYELLCPSVHIGSLPLELLKKLDQSYRSNEQNQEFQYLYSISSPDERQTPLNFCYEASHKNDHTELQNIEETVKKVLDNQLKLAKKDTIKNIAGTLERSRSSLKALKTPDFKLGPLTEFCDLDKSDNIEEVHIFSLNGLDQLLQLMEKKWTRKMLINTAVVVAMGISQIAIGTVMELYSIGCMTHVGAGFVSEGLNDIFFAASALKSGYFSWKDYRQHKIQSLLMTAVTCGVGAWLSRGTKVSRFGYKLAGPNLEIGGKKVMEMCGTELIKTAGLKKVGKEALKRIILKTGEGIAFGLANTGVDMLVDNYLQRFCEGIASNILSDVELAVERHNISTNLQEIYNVLGKEEAKKIVDGLTSVTTLQSYVEKFSSLAKKIASSITRGMAEASTKRSFSDDKMKLPLVAINKLLIWSERAIHIYNLRVITEMFLDNLDGKIKDKLNDDRLRRNFELDSLDQEKDIPVVAEKDFENFKGEIINHWKSLLRKNAGQVISQHIVIPVLGECTNRLVGYIGKKVQEGYHSYEESRLEKHFGKRERKYREDLKNANELMLNANASEVHDGTSRTARHITEKYHDDLLKLLTKSNSPKLFAAMVRENTPMDLTCVSALHKAFEKRFPGLTIIVKGEGGIRQEFTSSVKGVKIQTIVLELKDNHFQLGANSVSKSNENSGSNNCLIDAVSTGLGLKVSEEKIRAIIADQIEQDPDLREHIQQGWHKLPLSLNAFGGHKRIKTIELEDESSETNDGLRSGSSHLTSRLKRFIRLGGIQQRISEETGISRDEVLTGGASQFQDRSSGLGNDIHAAHVVRVNEINPEIGNEEQHKLGKSSENYNELRNFLGHTQNVERIFNEWKGVGGVVDKFQSENLKKLAEIDFSTSLTAENRSTIQSLRGDFVAKLQSHIEYKENLSSKAISEIKETIANVNNISIEDLIERGKGNGYEGRQYMKRYREGRKRQSKRSRSVSEQVFHEE